ncbi:MAG: AraC family transcriptional regulator [Rhodovulum sulfidophilum]|uniref:AraC family transcriptional regulator n=1 Tax=Rhodovulum sulfidophilum TaxID=35806 RepID=A0A2W5NCD0_RHOSU|nr:MAG: AraC family transcriptional regulator [Rhodovulum sulfidophilum]
MPDPLAQVIQLLRPRAVFSKGITGAGRWAVRYAEFGQPGFCAVIDGRCRLAVDGEPEVVLEAGDFVLLPATPAFTMSGLEPAAPVRIDPRAAPPPGREIRHGRADGPPDVRQLGGTFAFGSPDAALIVALLPRMIHIRGAPRLAALVRMLGEEAARDDIGRELILARLVEILLIEALRAAPAGADRPGLLRGLADPRVATALRRIHGDVARPWTVADLAREAGLSRSAFFDRFRRVVGLPPMEYALAWRMAVAKELLRNGGAALDEVARRVGYASDSTFSTAFSRHVGVPPGRFRKIGEAA